MDLQTECLCCHYFQFTSQIKKSEGTKPPKVEVTISIDGVAIQEPKSKV